MEKQTRVVVVDDEPRIGDLLKRMLGREGYDVGVFTDAASALADILARRPDLLITDVKMEGMDGLELLRRVRTLDPDMPVVLITAYSTIETAHTALDEHAEGYITKPFSAADLRNVVVRLLENRRLAAENRLLLDELKLKNAELVQHRDRLTLKVRETESDLEEAEVTVARRVRDLEVLREISQMTSRIVDARELLDLACRLVRDKVDVDAATAFLIDADTLVLTGCGVSAPALATARGDVLPAGEGILGHAVRTGDALLVPRAAADPRLTRSERTTFGPGALLLVPIRTPDRTHGLLALTRAETRGSFGDEERRLLTLIAQDLSDALERARLFTENEHRYIEVLAAMVTAMESRDPFLERHSERVRIWARRVADALAMSDSERNTLDTGARLHDLGKIGVKDSILTNPGRLDDDEMDEMRRHPAIGDRIVRSFGRLAPAKAIIRHHHERWDGEGYPDRLGAQQIPFLTQIVTLADAYDAMTSLRPYRQALPRAEALRRIISSSGTQFNPFLVEVFRDVVGSVAEGAEGTP